MFVFWTSFGMANFLPPPSYETGESVSGCYRALHLYYKLNKMHCSCAMWQLGLEMRPFFNKESPRAYPAFGAVGGSLMRIENKHMRIMGKRRERLLMRRQRRAEREAAMLDQ
jgi:hypothetical protein